MIDMKILRLLGIGAARLVLEWAHWRISPMYPGLGAVLVRRANLRDAWHRVLHS